MTRAPTPAQVLAEPAFGQLLAYVVEHTGLAWYEKETATLALHVAQRMAASGVATVRAYLDQLRDSAAELDALVARLTVGETYFFRHTEAFTALREVVLPDLLERLRHRRSLRIWSAGCANGAEAYSLAILLRSQFGVLLQGWDVAIIGTDINREALALARAGRFGAWALRAVAPEVVDSCFIRRGELWEIRPEYRQGVSFRPGNLALAAEDVDPCGQDLVLCRNVMIYFDARSILRTLERLHRSLHDGGWLLTGPSETVSAEFRGFQPVARPGVTLYRCTTGAIEAAQPRPVLASGDAQASFPSLSDQQPASPVLPWSLPALPELPPAGPAAGAPGQRERLRRHSPRPPATAEQLRALADRGAYAAVLQESERMLREAPGDAAVHYYRALVLGHLQRQEECEQALRNAIYLDRQHVLAHYELAQQLRVRGDRDGALRSLRNVLRLLGAQPTDERLHGEDVTVGELAALAAVQIQAMTVEAVS